MLAVSELTPATALGQESDVWQKPDVQVLGDNMDVHFAVPARFSVYSKPSIDFDKEARDEIRDTEDLIAQKGMEESARQMVYLSIAQLILGIAGTIALIQTLRHSRIANDAAQLSVKVSREAASTQLRAWVSYKEFRLKAYGTEGAINHYVFIFDFCNTGSTPATNCQCVIMQKDSRDIPTPDDIRRDPFLIAPAMSISQSMAIDPADIESSRDQPFVFVCDISYDTVFPELNARRTLYTFEVQYVGIANETEFRVVPLHASNFSVVPGDKHDIMT